MELNNKTKQILGDDAAKIEEAARNLPGAAVNRADDNKDNRCLNKQDVRLLNDNPRSDDGPNPYKGH